MMFLRSDGKYLRCSHRYLPRHYQRPVHQEYFPVQPEGLCPVVHPEHFLLLGDFLQLCRHQQGLQAHPQLTPASCWIQVLPESQPVIPYSTVATGGSPVATGVSWLDSGQSLVEVRVSYPKFNPKYCFEAKLEQYLQY